MENIEKIFEILRSIPVTEKNRDEIHEIRQLLIKEKYIEALARMKELQKKQAEEQDDSDEENEYKNDENVINEEEYDEEVEEENKSEEGSYPKKISDKKLEKIYIGLLLINPKLIRKYYFVFDDCFFEDLEMLNLYKSILYNEGSKYSSEKAKEGFNFPKETEET